MTQDRRLHPRLIPDSALLVSVDRLRRAFLSDLSEGGMAFDGLVVEGGPSVMSVAFNLPDGGGAIEAIAEVVWTCESRHRTGVRFLELAEECRQRLREWLSARVVALESPQGAAVWDSLSEITGAARNWILQEIGESGAPDQPGQPPGLLRTREDQAETWVSRSAWHPTGARALPWDLSPCVLLSSRLATICRRCPRLRKRLGTFRRSNLPRGLRRTVPSRA